MKTIITCSTIIDEVNPKFNAEKFEAMLANDVPGGMSRLADGKPEFCSWYHLCNEVSHCTTIFTSYRQRVDESDGEPGELVASGRYLGEPGEWRLSKHGPAIKAPYEE